MKEDYKNSLVQNLLKWDEAIGEESKESAISWNGGMKWVGGVNGCGGSSFRGGRTSGSIGGACGSTWTNGRRGFMKGLMIGDI